MMFDQSIQKLRARKGIGLLELMLALAIIAVLIIMATRYYQTTARSSRMNDAVQQVNAIVAAANNYKVGQGSYTGIDNIDKLISMGVLPSSAKFSPWGTTVTVTGASSTVTIKMAGVSSTDCNTILQRLSSNKNIVVTVADGCTFTYNEAVV